MRIISFNLFVSLNIDLDCGNFFEWIMDIFIFFIFFVVFINFIYIKVDRFGFIFSFFMMFLVKCLDLYRFFFSE